MRYRPMLVSPGPLKTDSDRYRQGRGCVVLGLRSESGIAVAGVVECGYGRDLVEQLPEPTGADYRRLSMAGALWNGSEPIIGEVKYLEWSPAGGLRHATLVTI